MQTADIYLITNLINGKQYVGQTIRGYKVRWKIHCRNAKHCKSMKSKEVREKISKSVKSSYTPELRQWFSEHSKNIWNNWTQEQKNNCVKGLLEYNNKQKQRIAALNKKDESLFKEFESASKACKYFGRPCKEAGNLLRVCDSYNKNGKRKSHYGYYWIKL